MISEDKIEKNKKVFLEINKKYNVFTPDLLDFLGEDFFIAPASASLKMSFCYPGGLLEFLMTACKFSLDVNNIYPEPLRLEKETIVRTIFLSQIGKTFLFKMNTDEWQVKKIGKMYTYADDEITIMSVGERSAYYALNNGVKLTDVEYQTILNLDKDSNEKFMDGSTPLYYIIKTGIQIALLDEKERNKNGS